MGTIQGTVTESKLNPCVPSFVNTRHNYVKYNGQMAVPLTGIVGLFILSFMGFILILSRLIICFMVEDTNISISENATNILREIRVRNVNRVIIGTLNINSLPFKFEQLQVIIGNYLDILIIQETKLDISFPTEQFHIDGYKEPYRLDRNRNAAS